MNEFQVTCINKPYRDSVHEHITHIGNCNANWRMTRETAIQRIEGGNEKYFVLDTTSASKAYIGVVRERDKHPYLRTYADNTWNDNLLAQPECDSSCPIIG